MCFLAACANPTPIGPKCGFQSPKAGGSTPRSTRGASGLLSSREWSFLRMSINWSSPATLQEQYCFLHFTDEDTKGTERLRHLAKVTQQVHTRGKFKSRPFMIQSLRSFPLPRSLPTEPHQHQRCHLPAPWTWVSPCTFLNLSIHSHKWGSYATRLFVRSTITNWAQGRIYGDAIEASGSQPLLHRLFLGSWEGSGNVICFS